MMNLMRDPVLWTVLNKVDAVQTENVNSGRLSIFFLNNGFKRDEVNLKKYLQLSKKSAFVSCSSDLIYLKSRQCYRGAMSS